MNTALTSVLTRPVAQIVASFMEFAPGVPDTDVLLRAMMLKMRKKMVDHRGTILGETCVRVCEEYKFKFYVSHAALSRDDDSYSLQYKYIHGFLIQQRAGFREPWIQIDYVITHPATPKGFREMRSDRRI